MSELLKLLHLITFLLLVYKTSDHNCLTHIGLTGPSQVELSSSDPVRLLCSFLHTDEELKQLDVKWYKDKDQTPFLQWIPSLSRKPQLVDESRILAGNIKVGFRFINSTELIVDKKENDWKDLKQIDQILILENITTEIAGEFHCRVATFFHDVTKSQIITVFDPGTGPRLHHLEVDGSLQVTCKADDVFPLPLLTLGLSHDPGPGDPEENFKTIDPDSSDLSKVTIRRGSVFSVCVKTFIPLSELSSPTLLTCSMTLPGSDYPAVTVKSVYIPGSDQLQHDIHYGPKASMVSNALSPVQANTNINYYIIVFTPLLLIFANLL